MIEITIEENPVTAISSGDVVNLTVTDGVPGPAGAPGEDGEQGPAGEPGPVFDFTANQVPYIDLVPSGVAFQAYRLGWDDESGTLAVGITEDVTLQMGQEIHARARNAEGSPIPNGALVYVYGAQGSNATVRLASASAYNEAIRMVAIATEDVAYPGFGYFTTQGIVRDVDTDGIPEGTVIYLGEDGAFTATPPVYPANRMAIGVCLYEHQNEGRIYFSPRFIFRKFGTPDSGHYTGFDDNGHQRMYGNARPYRDELGDALSLRSVGPGVSANFAEATIDFVATSDLNDYLYKNLQLNHDRDESSAIWPHLHFFQNQNAVPNFLLQYRWQINGGAQVTGWTNLRMNIPAFAYTAGTIHQIAHTVSGIIPPSGSIVSDIVQLRILRDNANASGAFAGSNPYTGTVQVLSFDVHIQLNSVGSDEQYLK